jgi:hypothetical protein
MGDSWIITVPNEALTPQAAFDRIKAETGHLAEVHRFEIPMHALQVGTLDSLMVRPLSPPRAAAAAAAAAAGMHSHPSLLVLLFLPTVPER